MAETESDCEFQASSVKRRWLHVLLRLAGGLILVSAVLVTAAYFSIKKAPAFYSSAIQVTEADAFEAGAEFETAAFYLRNDIVTRPEWSAWFSEDQINGWLSSDMARKFPDLLPAELSDPRVSLREERLVAACRFQAGNVDAVLVAEVDVFRTDVPDQFGVKIYSTRAGLIPLPVSFWQAAVAEALIGKGVELSWTEDSDGTPVALLNFAPSKLTYEGQRFSVDEITLSDTIIEIAGHSTLVETPED